MEAEFTRVEIELPTKLVAEMRALVDAGWFRHRDALIAEAVRRYLESHRPEIIERFASQDVDWALGGAD